MGILLRFQEREDKAGSFPTRIECLPPLNFSCECDEAYAKALLSLVVADGAAVTRTKVVFRIGCPFCGQIRKNVN